MLREMRESTRKIASAHSQGYTKDLSLLNDPYDVVRYSIK